MAAALTAPSTLQTRRARAESGFACGHVRHSGPALRAIAPADAWYLPHCHRHALDLPELRRQVAAGKGGASRVPKGQLRRRVCDGTPFTPGPPSELSSFLVPKKDVFTPQRGPRSAAHVPPLSTEAHDRLTSVTVPDTTQICVRGLPLESRISLAISGRVDGVAVGATLDTH